MEGRATQKAADYMKHFKDHMKNYILQVECPSDAKSLIMQEMYNYDGLTFTMEDFSKRKRTKNIVPLCDRCCAKRANNEQCTRKRRDGSLYCGTHVKGTPHGSIVNPSDEGSPLKQVELVAQEIKGIIYYLDSVGNVYKTEHVLQNKVNPSIIAKYVKTETGEYSIPEFNI